MKKFIACLILLFTPFFSYAQAATPSQNNTLDSAQSEASLARHLSQFQSMQATFTQTIRDARGRLLDQSTGEMQLLRPGKFRWETLQPQQQLVIANGDIVWIYDKDLEQATRQKQKPDNTSPALLLSSPNQRLLQGFTITEIKNTGFLLKPKKSQDALFSRLLLQFDQDQLQSLKIEDKLGQITLITFSQIKTNLSLPENTFQFTPPSGVDVIEN